MTSGTQRPATNGNLRGPYSQRARTERQIAISRAVLAAFSLAGVWLDPAERIHFGVVGYSLIGVYVVYAVVLTVLVPHAARYLGRLQVGSQAVDIAVFSAFIYFTDGPASLFFVFFVFVIIEAALRWRWRGIFATALVAIAAFLSLEVASGFTEGDGKFEFNGPMIGVVSLGVIAWLLAFLGLHEARLRQGVDRLAMWSQDVATDETEEARRGRMLAHAANAMGASRVVFAWENAEEPWLGVAAWDGQTSLSRAAPEEFSPLVHPDLEDTVFLCPDVGDGSRALCMRAGQKELHLQRGTPVHRTFADRFNMGSVISAPVNVAGAWARLFFLDKPNLSSDDLALARVVAAGVGLLVEESRLQARLRESVAYEERVHLAGDLHDGVLQALTGTAIQLETAHRLLDRDMPAAKEIIKSVQQSLAAEQRNLRLFVDELKPRRTPEGAAALDLRTQLLELRDTIARQWGLDVDVALDDLGAAAISDDGLTADVYLIVREGLVNSARHAHAKRAWAAIRSKNESLDIVLEDDGDGFPFLGRHDMASLEVLGAGPAALLRRVAGLEGTLLVDSRVAGSRLEISIPLGTKRMGPPPDQGAQEML